MAKRKRVSTLTKVYPDTRSGAAEFIAEQTTIELGGRARFTPDPVVAGVWKVTGLRGGLAVIIYMAGYPDPMGDVRGHNDFEEGRA